VDSRVFPLYEVVDGRYRITRKPGRPTPVAEYLRLQGRFSHLDEAQVATIQTRVDERWARLETFETMTAEVVR